MKKYSLMICLLLTLSGCKGHNRPPEGAAIQPERAACGSHGKEIDCSWNIPDRT